MKEAMIEKRMTLRELWKATEIDLSRLSDLKLHRAVPTGEEADKIAAVLGSKIRFAGMDEAKKNKAKFDAEFGATMEVFKEAKRQGFKIGHGGRGKMKCPKCGNDLHFSVSSFNGHVWAKCSTDKCIGFMQ